MPKSIKLFRDKEKANVYRNNQRKKNYDQGDFSVGGTKRRYESWEIPIIMAHENSDRVIARRLSRSVAGIQQKRGEMLAYL